MSTPSTPSKSAAQSRLGAIQPSRLDVPSHHHQAIARVGRGLDVVALAEDGTIEAVEDPGRAYLIGVQWHPEVGGDDSLFEGLVEAAKAPTRDPGSRLRDGAAGVR